MEKNYSLPPSGAVTDDGLLRVSFRCGASRIAEVSTANQTSYMKAFIVLYWTDPRMAGWEGDHLPDELWGPFVVVRNALKNEMSVDDHEFQLIDRSKGRMKRFILCEGTVVNHLDLKEFPFDFNSVDIEFGSVSHWRTKDGSKSGSVVGTPSYYLCEVRNPAEGERIGIYWDGHIPEWQLHGASFNLHRHSDKAGFVQSQLKLSFQVSRSVKFYVAKILVPLYLLIINLATIFFLPVDDLSSRSANSMTGFLAAFAFLFVVGESLPKVDFLTRIDKVIMASLGTITAVGLESGGIYVAAVYYPVEVAERANWICGMVTAIIYIAINILLFVPAMRHRERRVLSWMDSVASQQTAITADAPALRSWMQAWP